MASVDENGAQDINKQTLDSLHTDLVDFKSYVLNELISLKDNQNKCSTEQNSQNRWLEEENCKLKHEITRLNNDVANKNAIIKIWQEILNHTEQIIPSSGETFMQVRHSNLSKT